MSPTGVSNVVLTSSGDESDFGIILNDTTSFDSVDYTYVVVTPGASGSGDSGDSGSGGSGSGPTCEGAAQEFAQKTMPDDYKSRSYPTKTESADKMFIDFCGMGQENVYHKFQLLNADAPENMDETPMSDCITMPFLEKLEVDFHIMNKAVQHV